MKDLRADMSAWLALDLSKTLEAAKEISIVQSNCASAQSDTVMCLRRAENALAMLDNAREGLARTIRRTEHYANCDS